MGKTSVSSPVQIRPELANLTEPIEQVTGWPGNPRRGDLDKIKQSLATYGQYAPLLVQRSTGWVVKGNNTLIAMRELGATDVAVQRMDLTDEQARKILLFDNKTSDDASYDDAELAALLSDLDDLDATGWSTAELDDLMRATDHLGNQATAFLDDMITAAPEPAAAAAAQAPPPPPPAAVPAPPVPVDPAAAAAAPAPLETPIPPAPQAPAVPGEPVPPPQEAYVQLSWTCTVSQRDLVRQAIREAQSRAGVPTAVEGLTTIAQHYLTTAGVAA